MNQNYCFENFGVGPSNQFAHAASLSVADEPGKIFNPLFIYGGVGLGKTHLLNAIGIHLLSTFPQMNVLYLSGEDFRTELVTTIVYERIQEFREKYGSIDCLLTDNIDLISREKRVQEEFFYTFNTLCDDGKQVVATSKRNPVDLFHFHSAIRLHLRLEDSLIADIQPLDHQTKIEIIKKKASVNGIKLTSDAASFIALQAVSVKEIETILVSLLTYSLFTNKEIDLFLVAEMFIKIRKD